MTDSELDFATTSLKRLVWSKLELSYLIRLVHNISKYGLPPQMPSETSTVLKEQSKVHLPAAQKYTDEL